jgi:polysaccharide export outer membrane protein
MAARKRRARARLVLAAPLSTALAFSVGPGCRSAPSQHEINKIPQYGVIDPNQPRELTPVTIPPRIIQPPDELEVMVRPSDPDMLSTRFVVQPEGTIDLGRYGDVYVAGMPIDQIEQKVTLHLARMYALKDPDRKPPDDVVVRLNDDQSKFYYVVGVVNNPSRYPVTGQSTVLDAILQAGLKVNSLPNKAHLARPHPMGAPDTILRIDWEGITQRGDTTTNYQLLPGDRIYVPGTRPPSVLSSLLGSR